MRSVEAHWWTRGNKRLSRRSLLRGTALGAGGFAAALALGCEKEPQPIARHIYLGEIDVSRGVFIRTEPKMKTEREHSNTVPWSKIKSVNGVELQGANIFKIHNPLIVLGENPGDRQGVSPWIQITATIDKRLLGTDKRALYINMSHFTIEYVKPDVDGTINLIMGIENGELLIGGDRKIRLDASEVGRVTVTKT